MQRTSSPPRRLSPNERRDLSRLQELNEVFFPSHNHSSGSQRKNKEDERTSLPPLPFRATLASPGFEVSSPLPSARGFSPPHPYTVTAQPTGFGSNSVFKDPSSIQLILPNAALEMSSDALSSQSIVKVKGSLDSYVAENLNGRGGPRVDTSTYGPNAFRAASPSRTSRPKIPKAEDIDSTQVNVLVGTPSLPPINITHFMGEKQPSDRRRVQVISEWLDKRIKGAWHDFQSSPIYLDKTIRDQFKMEQGIICDSYLDDGGGTLPSSPYPPGYPSASEADAFTSFPHLPPVSDELPSPTMTPAHPFSPPVGLKPYAEIPISPMFGVESRQSSPSAFTRRATNDYEAAFESVNRNLLASTLTSVSACATSLIQQSGSICFEEGALFARLWNLQTAAMDAALSSSRKEAAQWSSEAQKLGDKVKVLEPLIDWERDAKVKIDSLSSDLESTKNLLALACSERDAALHENNKIIVHYRKELKEFKKKQRRDAFQLACKVKNQLKQLELMQKDRDQLIAAVNSTKSQVAQLQTLAVNLRTQVSKIQQGEDESIDIDVEVKAMQQALSKLNEMVKETEESYFASEEQLTLVSEKDEVDEELVDMVLSEGDPDGKPLVDLEADLIRPMMADDELIEEEEEEEESPRSPRSPRSAYGKKGLTLTREERAAAAALLLVQEEPAAEKLDGKVEPEQSEVKVREFVEASIQTDPIQSPSRAPSPVPAINLHDASVSAMASMADATTSAHATPRPPAALPPTLRDSSHQTEIGLLAPLIESKVQEAVQAAKIEAAQLVATRVRQLAGVDLLDSSSSRSSSPLPSKGSHHSGSDDQLQVLASHISDSVLALKQEKEALRQESEAQKIKASKAQSDFTASQESVRASKTEADKALGKYAALKVALRAIGVDPDDPRLPNMTPLPPDPYDKDHGSGPKKARAGAGGGAGGGGVKVKPSSRSTSPTHSNVSPHRERSQAAVKANKVAKIVGLKKHADVSSPSAAAASESTRQFKALKPKAVDKNLTGTQKLQDAITKFEGVKPRTLEWLVKIIESVYKGKASSDEQRVKVGQDKMSMVDYIFQHLSGMFGTAQLVSQYAAQLVATIEVHRKQDVRVSIFHRFMTETWGAGALEAFLQGFQRLSEPARVPCCDFPSDHVPAGGSRMAQSVADVRKCLWVADKVLMKRHAKTAYAFAASLAVKGEKVPEEEVLKWFAAPGYYGPDVAAMRAQEQSRVEFRWISSHLFLEALVEEHLRCEAVYSDMLPAIFKRWDQDRDGLMYRGDLDPMFEHIAPKGTPLPELQAAAEALWSEMVQAEVQGLQLGNDADPGSSLPPISSPSAPHPLSPTASYMKKRGEAPPPAISSTTTTSKDTATSIATELQRFGALGFRPFLEGAMKCDLLRAYVRLYKTPPAKVRMDNSAQEQAKLLLFVLIQRHWAMHGESLTSLFKNMPGSLPAQMMRQVLSMEAERDGMRKAIMLHSILKNLIGNRMDRIITQLSISASGSSTRPGSSSLVQEDFELSLMQLTSAAKILFGSQFIIVDDVLARYSKPSPAVGEGEGEVYVALRHDAPSSILTPGLSPRLTPRPSPRPQGPSSISIKDAQMKQDLQILKLFNLLKTKMPELSRSYLASHPSVMGRSIMSRSRSSASKTVRHPNNETEIDQEGVLVSPDPLMGPAAGRSQPELMSLGRSVSFAATSPAPGMLPDEEQEKAMEEEDPDELITKGRGIK